MESDRYHELLSRWALGELSDAEGEELRHEMARRGGAGRAEAERIREVVGSLGFAASPREPPAALRERVLAAIEEESSREPEGLATPTPAVPRVRRRGKLWSWVAVAATLTAIGLGLYSMQLREALNSTREELRGAEIRAADTEALQDSLAELVSDVSALIGSRAVTLSGTSSEGPGRARVFVDLDSGRTLLLVDDLPVLPPEQVYQLWVIRGTEPSSAGVFRLEGEGPAWIELPETTDVSGADLLAVTVERAPGAPAPTKDPILAGEI